jgi:Enolase C-terminal domain-like
MVRKLAESPRRALAWGLRTRQSPDGTRLARMIVTEGSERRPIRAYGSGIDLPQPLRERLRQVDGFLARGLPGVKVKVGRPDRQEDEARVAAVRALIGPGVDLMVDANMAWTAEEALERGHWRWRTPPGCPPAATTPTS